MTRPLTLETLFLTVDTDNKVFGAGSGLFASSSRVQILAKESGGNVEQFRFGTGDFTIEFWYNFQETGTQVTFYSCSQQDSSNFQTITLRYARNEQFEINGFRLEIQESQTEVTPALDFNTWYHIAYTRSNGVWRFFVDGVQTDSGTNVIDYDNNSEFVNCRIENSFDGPEFLIDDFRISNIGRYTENFTPPAAAFESDSNTLVLIPFDTDPIIDLTGETFEGEANLNTSFSLQAEGIDADLYNYVAFDYWEEDYTRITLQLAQANLSSTTSLTSQGEIVDTTGYFFPDYVDEGYVRAVQEGAADLTAQFDIESTPGFVFEPTIELEAVATKLTAAGIIGDFFVPMDNTATLAADVQAIRDNDSVLSSNFNQIADAVRIRTSDLQLNSVFDQTVEPDRIVNFSSDLLAQFDQNTVETRIINVEVSIISNFNQTTAVDLFVGFDSDLTAQFDQTVDVEKLKIVTADFSSEATLNAETGFEKNFAAELETIATKLTAVGVIGDFFVPMDVNTSLVSDLDRFRTVNSNLSADTDMITVTGNLISPTVVLNSQATALTTAAVIRGFDSDLLAQFDLTAEIGFVLDESILLNSEFNIDIQANVSGDFFVNMDNSFDVDCAVTRIKPLEAEIFSEFEQITVADRFAEFTAELEATAEVETVGGYLFDPQIELETIASKLIAAAKIADFFINCDITADLTATPTVFRSTSVSLTADFNQIALADRFAEVELLLKTEFNIDLDAEVTRTLIAILNSQFDTDIVSGILTDSAANLNSKFDLESAGGFIELIQYLYHIPGEDRSLKIQKEQRSINITQENRQITVRR